MSGTCSEGINICCNSCGIGPYLLIKGYSDQLQIKTKDMVDVLRESISAVILAEYINSHNPNLLVKGSDQLQIKTKVLVKSCLVDVLRELISAAILVELHSHFLPLPPCLRLLWSATNKTKDMIKYYLVDVLRESISAETLAEYLHYLYPYLLVKHYSGQLVLQHILPERSLTLAVHPQARTVLSDVYCLFVLRWFSFLCTGMKQGSFLLPLVHMLKFQEKEK